jgi:hypothetical protein
VSRIVSGEASAYELRCHRVTSFRERTDALTGPLVGTVPFTVATVTDLVPFAPTNTQLVPLMQLIALTADSDDANDEFAVH